MTAGAGASDVRIERVVTSGTFMSRKNVAKLSGFRHRIESGNIEVPGKLD